LSTLSKTAETVLARRYYLKDEKNEPIEDWSGLCMRVANAIATQEPEDTRTTLTQDFYDVMYNLDFLPNSPCLMNAGTNIGQLAACFVLPVDDSIDGIFDAIHNGAKIHHSGGGTGYSFSSLRPKNSKVKSTQGVASGPVSFMKVFDSATETIKQGGKRRGANMGVLRIDHPDIYEFIRAKTTEGVLKNFNLSVAITDKFMQAYYAADLFDLVDPHTNQIVDQVDAKDLFDQIIKLAYNNGEPGILFIDEANRANSTPQLGDFSSTNPCFVGSTIVAVADDRNGVSIKELSELGETFPVYSARESLYHQKFHWETEIKNAIAFKTGTRPVVKVTISDGSSFRCTEDHLLALLDGGYITAGESIDKIIRRFNSYTDLEENGYRYINSKTNDSLGTEPDYTPSEITITNKEYGTTVVSIKSDGVEDVYDLNVEDNHNFYIITSTEDDKYLNCSGVLVHNCGEQWLLPMESCNLGSINLGNFVDFDTSETDWERLKKVVHLATVFLDNVIDCNNFPIPEIGEMTLKTRKIGLGIMGLHDYLIMKKLPYASEEGREESAKVMQFVHDQSLYKSQELAKIRGPFPAYDSSVNFYPPRRNAALTSVQPTGTISMIADCGSGVEPHFLIVTEKHVMDGDKLLISNKLFEKIGKREKFFTPELLEKIKNTSTVVGHSEIPEHWQDIFKTAQDISTEDHIKMQGILQRNGVDSSISKTINLPNSATLEDVQNAYLLGYAEKCKGLTVYRDGSRKEQVLNKMSTPAPSEDPSISLKYDKEELSEVLPGMCFQLADRDNHSMNITICFDESEKVKEVFAWFDRGSNRDYKDKTTMWTTTCRLISAALRYGMPLQDIIDQLDKSTGHMADLPSQLSKLFKSFLSQTKLGYSVTCPDCKQGQMVFEEGCSKCHECGYSKCH